MMGKKVGGARRGKLSISRGGRPSLSDRAEASTGSRDLERRMPEVDPNPPPSEAADRTTGIESTAGESAGGKKKGRTKGTSPAKEGSNTRPRSRPSRVRVHRSSSPSPSLTIKDLKEDDETEEFTIRVPKKTRFLRGEHMDAAEKIVQALAPDEELEDFMNLDADNLGRDLVDGALKNLVLAVMTASQLKKQQRLLESEQLLNKERLRFKEAQEKSRKELDKISQVANKIKEEWERSEKLRAEAEGKMQQTLKNLRLKEEIAAALQEELKTKTSELGQHEAELNDLRRQVQGLLEKNQQLEREMSLMGTKPLRESDFKKTREYSDLYVDFCKQGYEMATAFLMEKGVMSEEVAAAIDPLEVLCTKPRVEVRLALVFNEEIKLAWFEEQHKNVNDGS